MNTPVTRLARKIFLLLALAGAVVAYAQSTQQVTVNGVIPVLMNLTVDTNNVILNFSQADYQADGTASKESVNATTFKVTSNTRWRLYVSANSQKFSFNPSAGGQDPSKNASDLSLSPNDNHSYFGVTTGTKDIADGSAGGFNDHGHTIPVSYKLNTTLVGDPPGTYTLVLTYTLMPQ